MKSCFLLSIVFVYNICVGQDSIRNLSMKEAIQLASKNNIELKYKAFDISIQATEIQQAGVRPNPVFNTQLLALTDPSYHPDYALFTTSINRQDWFQLTKRVQLYGIRKEKIATEEFLHDASIANYCLEKRAILFNTAIAWLDTWYAQQNQILALQSIQSLDTLISHTLTTDTNPEERLRLLILDDQYDMLYLESVQNYQKSFESLELSIGNIQLLSIQQDSIFELKEIDVSVDSLLHHAYYLRHEIAYQKAMIHYYQTSISLSKSQVIPSPEIGLIANPQNTVPYIGLFLTQPLPVFDRNQFSIQKQSLLFQQSQSTYESTRLLIEKEVRMAYSNYQNQILKMVKMEDALLLSTQLLNTIRTNYLNDKKGYLDIFEAERTWYETLRLYYKTDYELKKYYLELLKASGHFDLM